MPKIKVLGAMVNYFADHFAPISLPQRPHPSSSHISALIPQSGYFCYRRLKDMNYFNLARIERGTVVWPNDEDLAPEMLWEKSVKVR